MVDVSIKDEETTEVKEDKVEVDLPEDKITLDLLLNTRGYVVL